MNALNNVVGLNQSSVYEDIQTFLEDNGVFSVSTKGNYDRSIRKFFMYTRNKHIENLTVDDLKFRNADIKKYRQYLKEQYPKNGTVNAYMSAVQSLYEYFETNEYQLKAKTMKVNFLPDDSDNYGKITLDEARTMAKLVIKQVKGLEKSLLIRLAYITSIREGALLSLTWDDITLSQNGAFYVVEVYDKGQKKDKKPIRSDLYQQLLMIKEQDYYSRYNDNKIFHITTKTIWQMMNTLRKELSIPKERNIVFHSFKNIGIKWELETSGDINRAKRQGNHSDFNTTLRYVEEDGLESMAGLQMDNEINENVFDELSREELLKLVKSFGNGIGFALRTGAKKIVDGR